MSCHVMRCPCPVTLRGPGALQVWLIEINSSPGVAKQLLEPLARDLIDTAISPQFPAQRSLSARSRGSRASGKAVRTSSADALLSDEERRRGGASASSTSSPRAALSGRSPSLTPPTVARELPTRSYGYDGVRRSASTHSEYGHRGGSGASGGGSGAATGGDAADDAPRFGIAAKYAGAGVSVASTAGSYAESYASRRAPGAPRSSGGGSGGGGGGAGGGAAGPGSVLPSIRAGDGAAPRRREDDVIAGLGLGGGGSGGAGGASFERPWHPKTNPAGERRCGGPCCQWGFERIDTLLGEYLDAARRGVGVGLGGRLGVGVGNKVNVRAR